MMVRFELNEVEDFRDVRALEMLADGNRIKKIASCLYEVHSQTNGKVYSVDTYGNGSCTCPDFVFRARICKHIKYARELEKRAAEPEKTERGNQSIISTSVKVVKKSNESRNL